MAGTLVTLGGLLGEGDSSFDAFDKCQVEAKHELSTRPSTEIDVPFLSGRAGLKLTLSRRKFEALSRKLMLRLVPPMKECCEQGAVITSSAEHLSLTFHTPFLMWQRD